MSRKGFELPKQNLISLGYTVSCFETAKEATIYLDEQIDKQTVGFAAL